MNVADIIKRVQRQFGDDVEAQITQEDIVRWINDACLEIVSNNATNQGTLAGQTDVVAGTAEYVLPSDLYKIRGVRVNGKVVQATTYEQLVNTNQGAYSDTNSPVEGTPQWYWVQDYKINLYPQPNVSLGTLDVMYIKRPDLMDVNLPTRQPDVPAEYHPRIVEYCIGQAMEADDNLQGYQIKMGEFDRNLTKLKQNSEQPESEGVYSSITYVQDAW